MPLLPVLIIARNTPELRSWLGQREGEGRFLPPDRYPHFSRWFLPRWRVQSREGERWQLPGASGLQVVRARSPVPLPMFPPPCWGTRAGEGLCTLRPPPEPHARLRCGNARRRVPVPHADAPLWRGMTKAGSATISVFAEPRSRRWESSGDEHPSVPPLMAGLPAGPRRAHPVIAAQAPRPAGGSCRRPPGRRKRPGPARGTGDRQPRLTKGPAGSRPPVPTEPGHLPRGCSVTEKQRVHWWGGRRF